MKYIFQNSRFRLLLFLLAVFVATLMQSCISSRFNNSNWRRTPPSTGHSRCGCLMQKPYDLTPKQHLYEYQA